MKIHSRKIFGKFYLLTFSKLSSLSKLIGNIKSRSEYANSSLATTNDAAPPFILTCFGAMSAARRQSRTRTIKSCKRTLSVGKLPLP